MGELINLPVTKGQLLRLCYAMEEGTTSLIDDREFDNGEHLRLYQHLMATAESNGLMYYFDDPLD